MPILCRQILFLQNDDLLLIHEKKQILCFDGTFKIAVRHVFHAAAFRGKRYALAGKKLDKPPRFFMNCSKLCGQYKKAPW